MSTHRRLPSPVPEALEASSEALALPDELKARLLVEHKCDVCPDQGDMIEIPTPLARCLVNLRILGGRVSTARVARRARRGESATRQTFSQWADKHGDFLVVSRGGFHELTLQGERFADRYGETHADELHGIDKMAFGTRTTALSPIARRPR